MSEEVDSGIDGILNKIAPPPAERVQDSYVMEVIPSNEVYVVPPPESSAPLLYSSKLHQSLSRTRTWLLTLAILSFCIYGLCFLAAFVIGMKDDAIGPVHVLVGLIILLVSVIPLVYMMIYANRIQDFCFHQSSRAFLQMVSAQCAMWTIMGIYTCLVFLLGIAGLAIFFFIGFAMKATS